MYTHTNTFYAQIILHKYAFRKCLDSHSCSFPDISSLPLHLPMSHTLIHPTQLKSFRNCHVLSLRGQSPLPFLPLSLTHPHINTQTDIRHTEESPEALREAEGPIPSVRECSPLGPLLTSPLPLLSLLSPPLPTSPLLTSPHISHPLLSSCLPFPPFHYFICPFFSFLFSPLLSSPFISSLLLSPPAAGSQTQLVQSIPLRLNPIRSQPRALLILTMRNHSDDLGMYIATSWQGYEPGPCQCYFCIYICHFHSSL